jgi:hypothetical protein
MKTDYDRMRVKAKADYERKRQELEAEYQADLEAIDRIERRMTMGPSAKGMARGDLKRAVREAIDAVPATEFTVGALKKAQPALAEVTPSTLSTALRQLVDDKKLDSPKRGQYRKIAQTPVTENVRSSG